MAKITVLLSDDQHQRFVNAKMRLKLRSLQELLIASTEAALAPATQDLTENQAPLSVTNASASGAYKSPDADITPKGQEQTDNPERHEKAAPIKNSGTSNTAVDSLLSGGEIALSDSLESVYASLRSIGAMKITSGDELGLWGRLAQFVIMSQEPDLSLSLKCNLLMFGKSAVAYERASRPDAPKKERPDQYRGMEQLREMQAGLERDRAELARREEEHRAERARFAEREKEFERQMAEIQSLQAPMGSRKKGSRRKTG